jgi:hypothetical protein
MAKERKRKDSAGENVEAYKHETETSKNAVTVELFFLHGIFNWRRTA